MVLIAGLGRVVSGKIVFEKEAGEGAGAPYLNPGRRAVDTAQFSRRRDTHTSEKRAQGNFNIFRELGNHSFPVQPKHPHPHEREILWQHAHSGKENIQGIGQCEFDLLDPYLGNVARLSPFDIDRTGENVRARPAIVIWVWIWRRDALILLLATPACSSISGAAIIAEVISTTSPERMRRTGLVAAS